MRRLGLLINDVKFNANILESTRYLASGLRLMKLFNQAQRGVQTFICNEDAKGKYFNTPGYVDLLNGVDTYPLPLDIFAESAIIKVGQSGNSSLVNSGYYTTLRQISESERRREIGYFVNGKNIIISPLPKSNVQQAVKIQYRKRLRTLSPRIGKVANSTSGTNIKLTSASGVTDDITEFEDHCCVVDKDGVIVVEGIEINGYNTSSKNITTSSTWTATITNEHYVVLGKSATSHSDLPEICEDILTSLVHRMIELVDSGQSFQTVDLLTEGEKGELMKLFADSDNDTVHPPISDGTYLN